MTTNRRELHNAAFLIAIAWFGANAQGYEFAGGTGEPNDPYQIATAQQLISIGSDPNLLSKHFVLTADIDLDPNLPGGRIFDRAVIAPDVNTASGFQGPTFNGSFNGGGFAVRNLTIEGQSYLGLFGILNTSAEVKDLRIVNANIVMKDGNFLTGGDLAEYGGVLAGLDYGIITSCHVSGSIDAGWCVGGLVGGNFGHGAIAGCGSTVDIGHGVPAVMNVGGLVGISWGAISNSWASGAVGAGNDVGGLVGTNWGQIRACCASGQITGGSYLGGLVGENDAGITSSYATGSIYVMGSRSGGLVGWNYAGRTTNCYAVGASFFPSGETTGLVGGSVTDRCVVVNCFWNVEVAESYYSEGGVGLTTAQMMNQQVYSLSGWSDDPNWVLDAGHGYPRLAWEGTPGEPIRAPVIDWFEGSGTLDDPYIIASAEQLARIGTASVLWNKAYVLACDVNLAGIDFPRIGICAGTGFSGVFDGANHVVSNLTIIDANVVPIYSLGLFGHIDRAGRVVDLSIENAFIQPRVWSRQVGILGGVNDGSLTHCTTSGTVSGGDNGVCLAGGLVGYNTGGLANCRARAIVSGGPSAYAIGGLVGYDDFGRITGSCAVANIVCGDDSWNLGGLIGEADDTHVTDCYATGTITGGQAAVWFGGLIGSTCYGGSLINCYAATHISIDSPGAILDDIFLPGGLVGYDLPMFFARTTTACFWDTEASGLSTSDGGTGITTAQMQMGATFHQAGWDFDNTWMICEGRDYPHLQWENVKCGE